MSRVGKKPIAQPNGVTISVKGQDVSVKGPKGTLTLTLHGEQNVTWYQSSEKVRRGFCSICGTALFWDPAGHDFIAVAMGAFDRPTATHLEKHIFVADKGDYYEIADGLPQSERY